MSSLIRADNVSPQAGGTARNLPRGVAAAWGNLNGTGTAALRDSQNISGIIDAGTGDYFFNFTSVMANANYLITCDSVRGTTAQNARNITIHTGDARVPVAGGFGVTVITTGATSLTDEDRVGVSIKGSLA